MKRIYKILAMLLCIVMVTTTLASCNISDIISGIVNPGQDTPDNPDIPKPHYCESKCPKCGKCLDKTCTETACKDKCAGHTVTPGHQCDSLCPECGKCTDTTCTDAVCTAKCEGHVPPHACESKCDDCGKCTDSECTEDACKSKCQGHADGPANPAAYSYMPIISQQMPAIYINTPDGDNSWVTKYNRNDKVNDRIEYVDATVSTGNCDTEYAITDVAAEVKVRGNYTLEYPKKPIRIKFSKKNNLLGLHDGEKYKNWVLLADWKDLSMMNNSLAFYLGNTILGSDGYYCTDFRNVEVYLNGQYWGVYLLVEQQEAKDNRTSVPEVEDDYTGNDIGYFFEYDGYYKDEMNMPNDAGDPTFTMTYPNGASYRGDIGYTIKSDIYADSQIEFLRTYMNNAYYIAFEATKGNFYKFDENYNVVRDTDSTTAKQVVSQVIDVKSLVDIYILNEIACDLDVDWSSFYLSLNMTAEGNKKVTFEAPWDWDSCFGLRSGVVNNAQGLYAANKGNPWFNLLKNESWYQDMIREKWAEMKKYGLLDNAFKMLNAEKETYKDYYIANYQKWSERVYQGNGECNGTLNSYKDINTAQGLAADFLINWLTARFEFLDSVWYTYEAAIPEAYDPAPVIREEMAAIYINTPSDTANSWATKFNKGSKKQIEYVDATITVNSSEEEFMLTDVAAQEKLRGNATLNYEKKPIRIKFSKKNSLLGLHDGDKYKSWVLLADYKDLSMMNNSLAFYLGNAILESDGYYCTDFRNVEVYLNGQYWGVYLLVEQQEAKDGRSSVDEVEEDYTGTDIGYLFEYDGYYNEEGTSYLDGGDGDPTFTINQLGAPGRTNGYTVKSDLYSKDQLTFLQKYLENVFYIVTEASKGNYYKFDSNYNVVRDNNATDAKAVVGAVIDLQSLVDTYILNEIACDLDVDWSSFYLSLDMTADGNKKVTFEAPWDWDSCFGLRTDINNQVPNAQGIYAARKNPWFNLVTSHDWFTNMVKAKWNDMKDHGVLENTIEFLKAEKEAYKDYYIKNHERWPGRVTGGNGECNATLNSYRDPKTAQSLAADWVISWITKRFTFLDKQWGDGSFGSIKVDENLPEGAVAYRFEAEHAALANFTDSAPIRNNRDYASGNAYVGGTIGGATITFTINASEATTAYLFAAVSKMDYAASFDTWFSITVNGEEILLPTRNVDRISGGEEAWHTFVNVKLLPIELKKGENTIVFNCLPERNNLDYIELYSAVELN